MIRSKKGGREIHLQLFWFMLCMLTIYMFIPPAVLGKEIATCIPSERQALLQVKKGAIDHFGQLASWSEIADEDCCRWSRVGCDILTGHVIMLDLSSPVRVVDGDSNPIYSPLIGNLSSSLLELPFLSHLDLSNNYLDNIPEFIGSLSMLKYLNLSYNSFGGNFPDKLLGNLSLLKTLDLQQNFGFHVENIEWLGRLTSLRTLILEEVNFSNVSNWLWAMKTHPSLSILKLYLCNFPEVNPSSLSQVNSSKSLTVLALIGNSYNTSVESWLPNISSVLVDLQFSEHYDLKAGLIPAFLGNFKSLVHLDISSNNLEGEIPSTFRNLCKLKSLNLADNNFSQSLLDILVMLGCAKDSLEILSLSSNQLTGPIPDFTEFAALKELHLDYNSLDGPFPMSFQNLTRLEVLNVEGNHLSGSLQILMSISSLTELKLANNELNGSLSESIGQLANLTLLDISGNHLDGIVSEAHFSNLSKLLYLDLSLNSLTINMRHNWIPPFQIDALNLGSCKLGPKFPSWLETQKSFSHLDLSNTNISDTIPNWFWSLPPTFRYLNLSSNHLRGIVLNHLYGIVPNLSLEFYIFPAIDLSSNLLHGPIPLFLFNSTILNLSQNMFSGSLSFLCTIAHDQMVVLDLSNNLLSGDLTDCWARMHKLSILNLESNNFSGRIPSSFGSLYIIESMRLRNNSFTGEIPSTLKSLFNLKLLDLGENKLVGMLPPFSGESLRHLIVLRLRSNRLSGSIPSTWCNLSTIQILDLSSNNLSGRIPACLRNLTTMARNQPYDASVTSTLFSSVTTAFNGGSFAYSDYIEYNNYALVVWKGYEQLYGKTLGLLKIIDLSNNHLVGRIPREVTSLLGVKSLNLSRNNLTGDIPGDIGQLKALETLDLSHNHLSGGIPLSLASISFLGDLDLSYNNLSGRIPTGTQLQSFSATSYQGNLGLCGPPLQNNCLVHEAIPKPPGANQSGDWLDWQWLYAGIGMGFFVGLWGFLGPLLFSKSWQLSYFQFLDYVGDLFYFEVPWKLAKAS